MGLENPAVTLSLKATESLVSAQYCAGGLVSGTDFGVELSEAATDKPAGIIQNAPAQNGAAEVIMEGVSKYKAGGTIHVGDKLTPTTGGVLIATVTNLQTYWGVALAEASSGDISTMYVHFGMISL